MLIVGKKGLTKECCVQVGCYVQNRAVLLHFITSAKGEVKGGFAKLVSNYFGD